MEFLNYSSSYLVYRNHSTASGLVLMSCAAYLADAFNDVLSPWCRYLT